uniref:Protein SDA1 n=1 Tax=Rhabditophanes sp. KR3021 TaxID=114890 RepID=A0AC35UCK7_9BILA
MAAVPGAEFIRVNAIDHNLALLQEKVKKDPESYKEEFGEQFEHFKQFMKLLNLQPVQHRMDLQPILELVIFLSKTAIYYSDEAKEFAKLMVNILTDQGSALHAFVRESFCESLLSLRNRDHLDTIQLMTLFFELAKVEDKSLRKYIFTAIVSMVKKLSKNQADLKMKTKMQTFLFAKLKDSRAVVARISQMVLIDVFRRGFWKDVKTANAIAECVFHKFPKIQVASMKFFLGTTKDEQGIAEDSDSEDDNIEASKTLKEVMCAFKANKKTRKSKKSFDKTKKTISQDKKEKKESRSKFCNLYAIQSLYDAQQFADRVFKMLEGTKNEKFEIRLLRMALVARIIGVHKLQVLGFYSFLHRYLNPKQRDVTRILLYAAQACHELVPPDLVENIIKVIANNFVSDKASNEAIVVGLNSIRAIYAECPHAADPDLISDLVEYRSYKNKNVAMASKGIVTLFRDINPAMLHRKDRGRPMESTAESMKEAESKTFGGSNAKDFIPGAEILFGVEEGLDVDDIDSDGSEDWGEFDKVDKNTYPKKTTTPAKVEAKDSCMDETCEDEGCEDEECGDEECEDEECEDEECGDEEECEDEEGVEGEEEENEEEEAVEENPLANLTPAEKLAKAQEISENRIFSDADFKRIRVHQLQKAVTNMRGIKRKQTNADIAVDEDYEEKKARREEGDGLPRLNDIELFHKKIKKATKEDRLEAVKAGRVDRPEFNKRKTNGDHVGRTNREMAKKKSFSMIKQKVRGNNRQRSFRERQISLKNYMLKQKGKKLAN